MFFERISISFRMMSLGFSYSIFCNILFQSTEVKNPFPKLPKVLVIFTATSYDFVWKRNNLSVVLRFCLTAQTSRLKATKKNYRRLQTQPNIGW